MGECLDIGIGDSLPVESSQFGELLVTERTPIIELNSSYGTSALRDIEQVTGSGTVTSGQGEVKLSTGTTTGSIAELDSAEAGRYIPGYGAEMGMGVRVPVLPTGDQEFTWGGRGVNGDNGFSFGVDSTGLYIAITKGGTKTKTYQSDWNIDKLNGTGVSGYNIDITQGLIYQINFTWYGYGEIRYGVIANINGYQKFVPCHKIVPSGSASIESPNLYLFQKADNGTTTDDLEMYVGGRQYSIVGRYVPKYRFVSDYRGGVSTSTTVIPLVSFRTKTGFGDRSIRIAGMEVKPSTEDVIVEARLGCSLTGASWGTPTNHTAAECAVESDTSATALTNGHVIWSQYFESGKANAFGASEASRIEFDLPQQTPITLCVRTLSGTGTVNANFRIQEEW